MTSCLLCGEMAHHWAHLQQRDYLRCGHCRLVFLAPGQRLTQEAERAYYATHRNDPADAGYRRFLKPLFDALDPHLAATAEGLDLGCGPASALAAMLAESDRSVRLYDPLFVPDEDALRRDYDFVVSSEVIEHVHDPAGFLSTLDGLLRPGGIFGLMTGVLRPECDFGHWHYPRDPTHVCFYAPETLEWIGQRHGWLPIFAEGNVALYRKPSAPGSTGSD